MKKCPFCAEEIQDEAVLCRYCGRELTDAPPAKRVPIPDPLPPPSPKSTNVSPGVAIAVVVGAIALFSLLAAGGFLEPKAQPAPGRVVLPQVPFQEAPVVTKAEYNRLIEGMSYSDAVGVIGVAGDEISRSDLMGISTVMYSWANANGSNMNAMFQDGRLITKAQFGLP